MHKKKVAISLRVIETDTYKETRDALSEDWGYFFDKVDLHPLLIPNVLHNVREFLNDLNVDGIILSGGYDIGMHPKRDNTEKKMLEFAIEKNIPLLGVCRGMQVINHYFGGDIELDSNSLHVKRNHLISLSNLKNHDLFQKDTIEVNSFHNNIIKKSNLGEYLTPLALMNEDDTVEAFFHDSYPIIGVMWHPERDPNLNNIHLLTKIFHDKELFR